MTQAATAISRFHARPMAVKFAPSKGSHETRAKLELDPSLPNVRFYRFPDGSCARFDRDTGDVVEF